MSSDLLPVPFAMLTNQLHYALPSTKERLRARAHSSMPEIKAFYDAVAPHMDAIMTYLLDFPPAEKDLEPPVLRLVYLAKAFMEHSLAVELFNAPDEPDVWDFENLLLEDH